MSIFTQFSEAVETAQEWECALEQPPDVAQEGLHSFAASGISENHMRMGCAFAWFLETIYLFFYFN